MLFKTDKYTAFYNDIEKEHFVKRMNERIDTQCGQSVESFLSMYANPVINQMQVLETISDFI
jgi:hypothetical protein